MIEFQSVHKWFGKLHVLDGIDLKVEPGQVVVVCGPSGSGKSTLIRCVNLLKPIDQGRLLLDGWGRAGSESPVRRDRLRLPAIEPNTSTFRPWTRK